MACFVVPAVTAVATTGLRKKIPAFLHIEWLNTMLWGGVLMLIVEHYAHGEIVPYPPFLTGMGNLAEIPTMLKEMATVGGTMTLAIFLVWGVMVLIYNMAKRKHQTHPISVND